MTFPFILHLGSLNLHPHLVFELMAYSIGFQLWRRRQKQLPPITSAANKIWILVAVVLGAALGARALAWLETPFDPLTGLWIPPGKTIAGGLLGGWAAIEVTKKKLGIIQRTGDSYVLPLCIGIALGRVGCFLTGLDDHTYGIATSLPWGVDFGDGISRHPTQLYEALWLITLLPLGELFKRVRTWPSGLGFQAFISAYCAFRLGIEFLKPTLKIYLGLSAIQWASLIGLLCGLYQIKQLLSNAFASRVHHETRSAPK